MGKYGISIIIPEHDSLSIYPQSELLNINDIDSNEISSHEEDSDNSSLKNLKIILILQIMKKKLMILVEIFLH